MSTPNPGTVQANRSAPDPEKPCGPAVTVYRRFQHASAALQSPFLLFVRLYWGWQFAQSGWGRLHNLGRATDFFSSLGIPAPHATVIFISVLELVGGILFIAGLGTRLTGLLLAGDMLGAYLLSDRDALSAILSNPGKFYGADPYTFLFASVILLAFGPGRFSIDYWFFRRSSC